MIHAYDRDYLSEAMQTLGEAFDCAANRMDGDLEEFLDLFVATGIADSFGSGSPKYVAGMSGVELALAVYESAGLDAGVAVIEGYDGYASPEYWCGWILAYYQWSTGRTFANIARVLNIREVLSLYPTLHEAPEEKFVEVAEARAATLPSPLKKIREAREVTQAELAEMSGVSLRAIQQYEQRVKDINRAQVGSLWHLAQALGCRMEDLLEFPV